MGNVGVDYIIPKEVAAEIDCGYELSIGKNGKLESYSYGSLFFRYQ